MSTKRSKDRGNAGPEGRDRDRTPRASPRRLAGLGVAIVTPLTSSGSPDLPALSRLARRCAAGGVDVLYPLGTTGEGALLDPASREAVLRCVLDAAPGCPVVAGAGAISTAESVEQARAAADCGAHGVLVVTPPYVKPTLSGLMKHYEAVARAGLPVVAYVVPGRTALAVSARDQARILEIDGVAGVKEASGNLVLLAHVAREADRLGKVALVGDDALALPGIAVGAHGLVSVAGQVAPRSFAALVGAARAARMDRALAIHRRLLDLMEAMFWETNPLPVKQCLVLRGEAAAHWRSPLGPPEEPTTARLRQLLERLDLLAAPFAGDDPDIPPAPGPGRA
jgi:4-hydroxy-tetrahydrodipicolinate synthase